MASAKSSNTVDQMYIKIAKNHLKVTQFLLLSKVSLLKISENDQKVLILMPIMICKEIWKFSKVTLLKTTKVLYLQMFIAKYNTFLNNMIFPNSMENWVLYLRYFSISFEKITFYTEILTWKSWIVDFFTRFSREKTPQNNFSHQNFSVENSYL